MRPKRKPIDIGFVAFIDVMACGLGAVILLLVIVDFNTDEILPIIAGLPTQEIAVSSSEETRSELEGRLKNLRSTSKKLSSSVASLTVALLDVEIQTQVIEESTQKPPEPIKIDTTRNFSGELIGLKVDGGSIVVLLDTSSSMYSKTLIDNIYYAIAPSLAASNSSSKWRQAQGITRWLIDVAPDKARLKVASFSESTRALTSGWRTPDEVRAGFASGIAKLYPEGGTNLKSAFDWLAKQGSSGSQVFLITDGLPTKISGRNALSNFFSACSRDPKGFVSGECRLQILRKSVQAIANSSIELNVILLPLEGDPKAAPAFWALAKSKQGILFVPEDKWP